MKCPICRTKRFRRDKDSGLRFCINGHQMRGTGHVEVGDDEIKSGARLRRVPKKRKAKLVFLKGFKTATPLLVYEAFQLSLKAQVRALIDKKGFPPSLEIIVRDLWLAFVSTQGLNDYAARKLNSSKPRSLRAPMMRLNRNIQLHLIYMGCRLLRLPFLLSDVLKWADSGDIPFLNALDALPSDFMQHVSRHRLSFLLFKKSSLPTLSILTLELTRLQRVFRNLGISLPAINRPLVLLRMIKAFNVPLELYPCTEIIWSAIGYSQGLNVFFNESVHRPELLLLSCLIVSIRILYSFKNSKRLVFVSWLSNLPPIDELLASMKIEMHKQRAWCWSKRTLTDLDSDFHGGISTFASYCQDYLFDKTRLNNYRHGFHAIVEGILPSGHNDQNASQWNFGLSQRPPMKHALDEYLKPSTETTNANSMDLESDWFFTTETPESGFLMDAVLEVNDAMGEVDAEFAELIDVGSKYLLLDGRLVLNCVCRVENTLLDLVELFDIQTRQTDEEAM
ncbi:Pol I core factor CF [Chytriomyces hyalinus]|nr:Pol I core factor CF [Chytriomyces hyalinus]